MGRGGPGGQVGLKEAGETTTKKGGVGAVMQVSGEQRSPKINLVARLRTSAGQWKMEVRVGVMTQNKLTLSHN